MRSVWRKIASRCRCSDSAGSEMIQVLNGRMSSFSPEVSRMACVSMNCDISCECLTLQFVCSRYSVWRSIAHVATFLPLLFWLKIICNPWRSGRDVCRVVRRTNEDSRGRCGGLGKSKVRLQTTQIGILCNLDLKR